MKIKSFPILNTSRVENKLSEALARLANAPRVFICQFLKALANYQKMEKKIRKKGNKHTIEFDVGKHLSYIMRACVLLCLIYFNRENYFFKLVKAGLILVIETYSTSRKQQ